MKKSLRLPILLCALILATALSAVWHLSTRPETESGAILLRLGDQESVIRPDMLSFSIVHLETVNAKGETRSIDGPGILLCDALAAAGIDTDSIESVTVTASDSYSASVTGEELRAGRVWLTLQADDTWQLVLPEDADSRRNVRGVQLLEVA